MEKTLQNKPLLAILPFDHRSYFEQLLGFTEPLTNEQSAQLTHYKTIVYAGFKKSLELGVPKNESAILVDDVFGLDILLDAKKNGFTVLQSVEKSGLDHFEFEHADWQSWIEKVQPEFIKVLIRYNVDGDAALNTKTRAGLKLVSDYAHAHSYKFLIEILVPSQEIPDLLVRAMQEILNDGIEPHVWKIEGMKTVSDYEQVVSVAQSNGRDNVSIVVLGKNQTDDVVETWLKTGAQVPGVIGFAVGRTVFLNALMKFQSNEYTHDQAVDEIAHRFYHFYQVFNTPRD
jgi:5-dehydro-2-deoxygluconokinase